MPSEGLPREKDVWLKRVLNGLTRGSRGWLPEWTRLPDVEGLSGAMSGGECCIRRVASSEGTWGEGVV